MCENDLCHLFRKPTKLGLGIDKAHDRLKFLRVLFVKTRQDNTGLQRQGAR